MEAKLRKQYKNFIRNYLLEHTDWIINPEDDFRNLVFMFICYIYDIVGPAFFNNPENFLDDGFYDFIKSRYDKYASYWGPNPKLGAKIILTVEMSDGDVKEYDDVSGKESFMYDFCEDIRDIAGEDFASEEIDDAADAIFYEGIHNGGTLTEEEIYSLAQDFLFGE